VGVPSVRGPIAASVAGKAVEMATLVLPATVVPRALGPSDYGRFAVALTIVTLGSLALTLGGPAGVAAGTMVAVVMVHRGISTRLALLSFAGAIAVVAFAAVA
jgi:hypothetical protein